MLKKKTVAAVAAAVMIGNMCLPAYAESVDEFAQENTAAEQVADETADDSEQLTDVMAQMLESPAGTTLDKINMPTGEDFIARAMYLAELGAKYNHNRGYDFSHQSNEEITQQIAKYGLDCSELVVYVLASLGVSTQGFYGSDYDYFGQVAFSYKYNRIPPSTHGWNTNGYDLDGINDDVYWKTADGSRVKINVIKNGEYTWDLPYYMMKNGDKIPVGSVVLALSYNDKDLTTRDPGGDHMWFYMGEFSSAKEVKAYTAYLTEKNMDDVATRISPMWNYKDIDWRIESTGTDHGFGRGQGVQVNDHINNYNYQAGDARYYKIYAFAPPAEADKWTPPEDLYDGDVKPFSMGDANGDGYINVSDIAEIAAHIKGVKAVAKDGRASADINSDGRLDVTDISMLASHIKGISPLK